MEAILKLRGKKGRLQKRDRALGIATVTRPDEVRNSLHEGRFLGEDERICDLLHSLMLPNKKQILKFSDGI